MVHSQINKRLNYEEDPAIEKKDHEFEPLKYPIEMSFNEDDECDESRSDSGATIRFYIAFGKKNERFLKDNNIVYYPVYLVARDQVVSKIGVLEVESENMYQMVDEDEHIDPEKLPYPPLFFSFLTESYLSLKNAVVFSTDSDEEADDRPEDEPVIIETREPADTMFDIPASKRQGSKTATADLETARGAPFKMDPTVKMPKQLIEETKTVAEKIKSEFQESSQNTWIQMFLHNQHYGIQDNEGGGDCLFAVIRDAFQEVGKITTVETLREILAEAVTDDIFQQYRSIYLAMEDGIVENDREMVNLTKMLKEYKRRTQIHQGLSKIEHEEIIDQAKKAKKKLENLKEETRENAGFLKYNFGFMKNIGSLEAFREYIKTSRFWADSWAISTLEEKLNMKMIIFSEEAYEEGAVDAVLNCGEATAEIQKRGKFAPDYYIMTSYSGTHYRLITYHQRKILEFSEVPYDVKILILNKCMERNSGVFYLIQDLRRLKGKLGLDPQEGAPEDTHELEDAYLEALYDPNTVFVLDSHAPKTKYPGTSSLGEKIPVDKKPAFMALSKIKSWRQKLHDSSTDAPFTLNGKRWASVEHYYQAAKYRKQHPDFYAQFSLDSPDNDLNRNVAHAKIAGKKARNKYRPENVTIDTDFYDGERSHQERQAALKAKFENNPDMKNMLLLTRNAKLVNFVRQSPPEIDTDLMKLRAELAPQVEA